MAENYKMKISMGKYAEHMHQKLVPHPYLVSVNTCKYNQCIQKTPLDIETSSIDRELY